MHRLALAPLLLLLGATSPGDERVVMVTGFDRSKKPTFSVKAMQIAEEKQAVAQYGSSDSGASLGDILGEALKARDTKK